MKFFLALLFLILSACSTLPTVKTQHKFNPSQSSKKTNSPHEDKVLEALKTKVDNKNQVIQTEIPVVIPPSHPSTSTNESAKVELLKKPFEETLVKKISDQNFPTNYKKIGVILPLTGKNSALGQRALTAIRLGIDATRSDLSLALFDSQGTPDLAAAGVEKLLKDEQVIAILGGLGGKEAVAISEKADFFQVPFFTFSQKSDLTKNSDFTFRNSITASMQTSRIVEFAIQKLGLKKFAILYPNDPYGVEFANQFWDHVLAFGGSIVAAQVYNPKEVDLTVPVQKLVGTYYVDSRLEEYKNKIEALNQKKQMAGVKKKPTRESTFEENKLDPIVDFDALFIPDSSKVMGQALGFLKAADVNQMTYLGTNLWNTDDLSRRAHQTLSQKNNQFYFVDHLITDEQRKNSEFNSAFLATFNEAPSIIETQTYESSKIIKDLILSGSRDRKSLAQSLSSLGRRAGAYSEIYMNNSHEIIRDLTVFHLENGLIIPQ